MLIGHVTVADFALNFWTQERWIGQDQTTKKPGITTCHQGGNHPSHGVSDQDRRREPESLDKTNDIVGMVFVAIAKVRHTRPAMAPGIRHDHVIIRLESMGQRSPAGSIGG